MPEITYLRATIGDKIYLFEEKTVSKVVSLETLKIFPSPYGKNLNYLALFDNILIPLFTADGVLNKKDSLILILARLLDLAGVVIDRFIDFVKIDERDLKNALEVNEFYSERAIRINDIDCYFFDEINLFRGEE